jgi:hypothetical protein
MWHSNRFLLTLYLAVVFLILIIIVLSAISAG